MYHWNETSWAAAEAERAFDKAVRARRRRALARRLRRDRTATARLAVFGGRSLHRPADRPGVKEIPLASIRGTLEPGRATQFDSEFRPAPPTRRRWIAVWLAEHHGPGLPPIAVSSVGDGYVVRDGHHRVSVARARGALTISAIVG